MSAVVSNPDVQFGQTRHRLIVERLPPVSEEELRHAKSMDLDPPRWLRLLGLETSRQNVHCLARRTRAVKRILDIAVASLLLVLAIPILIVAAIAIKLTSPGPIFFTQFRAGLFGEPFRIFKLRTMHLAAGNDSPTQVQATDNRIFAVGKFLRKSRIDELPQLVNVLLGDMSMVGPRPECIEYMEELFLKVPDYPQRLGLKPGLTGIAQIEGGYANDLDSYRRKVAYDLIYLQNCCFGNDLRILARTTKVVCTGFGAL
ncbi:MAG: sugar transferase [Planctomycetota bacterium]